jgi:hypothetical protein
MTSFPPLEVRRAAVERLVLDFVDVVLFLRVVPVFLAVVRELFEALDALVVRVGFFAVMISWLVPMYVHV